MSRLRWLALLVAVAMLIAAPMSHAAPLADQQSGGAAMEYAQGSDPSNATVADSINATMTDEGSGNATLTDIVGNATLADEASEAVAPQDLQEPEVFDPPASTPEEADEVADTVTTTVIVAVQNNFNVDLTEPLDNSPVQGQAFVNDPSNHLDDDDDAPPAQQAPEDVVSSPVAGQAVEEAKESRVAAQAQSTIPQDATESTPPDEDDTGELSPQGVADNNAPAGENHAVIIAIAALLVGAFAAAMLHASGWMHALKLYVRRIVFGTPLARLFSHVPKSRALSNTSRKQIHDLVNAQPGVTPADISQQTGLSRSTVTYHLDILTRHKIVTMGRHGRLLHLYPAGNGLGLQQQAAYAALRNDRSRRIADYVREHPGSSQKSIYESLDIPASRAHVYLTRLRDCGLLDIRRRGNSIHYHPTEDLTAIPVA